MTWYVEARYNIGPDIAEYMRATMAPFYSQPWRCHHNLDHPDHVVDNRLTLCDVYGWDPVNPTALLQAEGFHDVIFGYGPMEWEEASAAFVAGLEISELEETMRLIRLTKEHQPEAGDTDGILLCDADLLDLASPTRCRLNARNVRREVFAYGELHGTTFTERDFELGRATWIRSMLDLPRIMHGPETAGCDAKIRTNLAAELELLEAAQ